MPMGLPTRSRARAAVSMPRLTARPSLLHGQFLARDRELLLELLADALQRPRFDAGRTRQACATRRIEFIKAAKDSEPQSLIGSYGRALLFAGAPLWQADRRQ